MILLLAGCIGFGLGIGQPISLVYTFNLSPPDQQGQVLGIRIMFNKGSQFFAPLIFGGIGGALGLSPIFIVSGGVLLCASYFGHIKETN